MISAMDRQEPGAISSRQPALVPVAALIACLMAHPAAICQAPSVEEPPAIEELEKKIEEAKKARQAKEQPPADAPAQPNQPDAAAPPKPGTLIIGNDAPCRLSIDGERIGDVLPAGARELTVQRGEHSIECTSTDEAAVSVSQHVKIKPRDKTFVELSLKDKVAAETARKRQTAAKAAPQPAARMGSFDELGGGLVRDRRTGLIWSAADNGQDINWGDASHYCAHHSMQLPSVAQLESLVDRSGAMSTPCQGRQCKVSGRFHLTGFWFWSKQREGARWAVFVGLDNGQRNFDHAGQRNNFRALCVRGA
jgi:hypothetical protein